MQCFLSFLYLGLRVDTLEPFKLLSLFKTGDVLYVPIHAIFGVCLASLSVQDWRCPVCPLASKSSPWQMKTLAVMIAYMIYDLVTICGSEMVAALWITEISSPFLHMRELLKEIGYHDTDLNLAVDVLFAFIFSFARMIGGPYLTYVTLTADNPMLIKVRL
ncbi:uncharacterized protein LOC109834533 [Asparagus officinalis]|uniref:uncharacterized protein LOC109834533 n=1 Tax=Asparagus officinalis TaxID=4686 RepID=UPI00098E16C1|nr:uncharacterized protein LOC109834533 [Asparagus officinalis]